MALLKQEVSKSECTSKSIIEGVLETARFCGTVEEAVESIVKQLVDILFFCRRVKHNLGIDSNSVLSEIINILSSEEKYRCGGIIIIAVIETLIELQAGEDPEQAVKLALDKHYVLLLVQDAVDWIIRTLPSSNISKSEAINHVVRNIIQKAELHKYLENIDPSKIGEFIDHVITLVPNNLWVMLYDKASGEEKLTDIHLWVIAGLRRAKRQGTPKYQSSCEILEHEC